MLERYLDVKFESIHKDYTHSREVNTIRYNNLRAEMVAGFTAIRPEYVPVTSPAIESDDIATDNT